MSGAVRSSGRLPQLHWAAASKALQGESVSGDTSVVAQYPGGILIAVVDALGHGPEAAFAAKVAATTLEHYAGTPVVPLARRCHDMLVKTRGVVAGIATVDLRSSTLTWISIGNVEGLLIRAGGKGARVAVVQAGGVLGYKFPRIAADAAIPLGPGDRLIFTTDGVREEFMEGIPPDGPPTRLADLLLDRFSKGTDDALVLAAEYHGGAA